MAHDLGRATPTGAHIRFAILVNVKRLVAFTALTCLALASSANTLAAAPGASSAAQESSASSRTWRSPQRSPARDRYKQIQLALKRRGYDPGPIDGEWGSKTSAALKRFEKDHDLRADGKLDALTLITLGLGPQRQAAATSQQPAEMADK
jgi:peptidoglycan hydrolase-like protein with peptidoglycan-binding domain